MESKGTPSFCESFAARDAAILPAGVLSTWLPGDANLDGKVDISDLSILASHFSQATTAGFADGDFDGNGVVDISDLTLLASNFSGGPQALRLATLPEPTALLVCSLGGLMLARRKH